MPVSTLSDPLIRFTRDNRCPLCDGWAELPVHHPQRCRGSLQGNFLRCQRVPSNKTAAMDCYRHWMGAGDCHYCGVNHSGATRPIYVPTQPRARNRPEQRAKGEWALKDAVRTIDFLIKDAAGMQVMIHRRFEFPDNTKTYRYLRSQHEWGTGGISPRDLPLYGTEDLAGYNKEVMLIVTEGEPARKYLIEHGYQAVAVHSGASNCPSEATWASVKEFVQVLLWPDADVDGEGEGLMDESARRLQRQGTDVWMLNVEHLKEVKNHFDAANWTGTVAELDSFLYTGTRVEKAPLVEADTVAAVGESARQLDERHVHRKIQRQRLSDVFDATNVEHLIERAGKIAICMERWMPALCRACGARPALIVTCHENLCPLCFQRRFLNDWMVRVEEDPRLKDIRWRLVRYIPREAVQGDKALKTLRNRFTEQRKRDHIQAGIIGNRCSREHGGIILLALPMECAVPETMGSFVAELVREDASERDLSSWLISEYEDEIREAIEAGEQGDTQYVVDWEASTRGRKRFSAFGKLYRTPGCSPDDMGLQPGVSEDAVAIPLVGFTGGNGHAGVHEKRKCPACGSDRLSKSVPYVTRDEIQNTKGYDEVKPPAY